jgi:hypothetical protein
MKRFWSMLFTLTLISLTSALTTVNAPIRNGTITLTQITLPAYNYNATFQVYQNGRYWFLATYNGQHRICAMDSASTIYTKEDITAASMSIWSVDYPTADLINAAWPTRIYRVGSDSIAFVVARPDSIIVYKRSNWPSPRNPPWDRIPYKVTTAIDTIDNYMLVGNTLQYMPPDAQYTYVNPVMINNWLTSNGSLVNPDSTINMTGVSLYGRPTMDFKGNLWTYGYYQNDTVLVKYERITQTAFIYTHHQGAARLDWNPSIDINHGYIGYNKVCRVNLNAQVKITSTDTLRVAVACSSYTYNGVPWKSYKVAAPFHFIDDDQADTQSVNYAFLHGAYQLFAPGLTGTNSFSIGYPLGHQYYVNNPSRLGTIGSWYDSTMLTQIYNGPNSVGNKVIRNLNYRLLDRTMSDTSCMTTDSGALQVWTFMTLDSMQATASDTTINNNVPFTRTLKIKNACIPFIKSITGPSWLTIQKVADSTFTLTGTPTTVGQVNITLTFQDSVQQSIHWGDTIQLNSQSYPTVKYGMKTRTSTLSFKITVQSTTGVIAPIVHSIMKVPQVKPVAFNLLGRRGSNFNASQLTILKSAHIRKLNLN